MPTIMGLEAALEPLFANLLLELSDVSSVDPEDGTKRLKVASMPDRFLVLGILDGLGAAVLKEGRERLQEEVNLALGIKEDKG
jgi:hypothetical protein